MSKSRLLSFQICSRKLWLQTYRRDLANYDARTLAIFAIGHRVGEVARTRVANGILLDTDPRNVDQAIGETRRLVRDRWNRPLFEAAFQREDMVIRADILEPDNWGGWRLIETKSSTGVRPYMLSDVASQAWTIQGSGLCLSSIVVRHVKRWPRTERQAAAVEFVDVDVSAKVRPLIASVPDLVTKARAVLAEDEPQCEMGPHCRSPFMCEFQAYCSATLRRTGFEES